MIANGCNLLCERNILLFGSTTRCRQSSLIIWLSRSSFCWISRELPTFKSETEEPRRVNYFTKIVFDDFRPGSATRFSEFSPLWSKFNDIWQFCDAFGQILDLLRKFLSYWANFSLLQMVKYWTKKSGHLVTLLVLTNTVKPFLL